jgi:CHAT domain-containing protein
VACAAWAAGVAAISAGAMDEAIKRLDDAAERFERIGAGHTAASTQVSKLIALAMLGRYDEAIACGTRARDTFLAFGDTLAAGKIEQNLGGMAWRRERYREAEQFHRAARARFEAAGDAELLVAAENALAADLAPQYRFREAAERYENALARAAEARLELRQAEIECNIGNLALTQGRYARALDYLERSRRRYEALGLPHETAFAEQELAEAYLELNLAAEAAAIYARVTPMFAALGLQAEQAWALGHHGQAALLLGRQEQAAELFAAAQRLFAAEGNSVSAANVRLFAAQLAFERGDYTAARSAAQAAEIVFVQARSHGRALLARWLAAEAARAAGSTQDAHHLLADTLREAERRNLPQIAHRCHASLGLLALASGDARQAETALERAITTIETLRAPLPSEELRTAFVADKRGPYDALVRLYLAGNQPRPADALAVTERARARALVEMLGRSVQTLVQPRDDFEAQLVERMTQLREELNWLYRRLADLFADEGAGLSAPDELHAAIQEREAAILDLNRQLDLRGGGQIGAAEAFDLGGLQHDLGPETVLVAYYFLDGELLAFVVSDTNVQVVRGLAGENQIAELVGQLRFQIDAMRRGARLSATHSTQLLRRVRHYLERLHTALLAPLEAYIGERRMVVVPHRVLHYVPFHALYDGERHLVERHDICTVPSASVLRHCLTRPHTPRRRAVLLGVPDARAPRVHDEVRALGALFGEHVTLLGAEAHSDALRAHAPAADVLHLACHGTFRPDNPLFSALHLADGLFTVRDAYGLDLRCDLAVLSGCETGVSGVAAGDELIGLARGFFGAGAPAVLVSLWTVEDASTAALMTHFYRRLRTGDTPARALRAAQLELMRDHPHPFFWAPFVLMGRW